MINVLKKSIKQLIPDLIIEFIVEKRRQFSRSNNSQKKIKLFEQDFNIISIGNKSEHTFFGYYDILPFNNSTNEIIYLQLKRRNPKEATVISHDLDTKKKLTTL